MISEYTLEDDELKEAILQWLENNKDVNLTYPSMASDVKVRWHYPAESEEDGTPRPTVVYNDRENGR
jgi:hypothetical protein